MSIDVLGSGWMSKDSYGSDKLGFDVEYASRATLRGLGKEDGLFAYPVKNFGRFPATAQRVCYVTALALRDAGLNYSKEKKQEVGLLGLDQYGCEKANVDYFQDYIDGGRSMARANLFIYTLPSSPLAEAAVHFGLQGPLYYYRRQDSKVVELMTIARRMIAEGQAEYVMVYEMGDTIDRCHVVGAAD
jgi:3-oxoacyl-[acyl-carrier-protein] synthase II